MAVARRSVAAARRVPSTGAGSRRRWYRTPSFVAGMVDPRGDRPDGDLRAAASRSTTRPTRTCCTRWQGPGERASAGHRRPRARRLVAAALRRAHRPAGGVPRRAAAVHHRDDARAARRLLRRPVRLARELARQRRGGVPVLRADHRARVRARPGHAQHLHRDHDRRLGLLHADHPRGGAQRRSGATTCWPRAPAGCRRRASWSATCCPTWSRRRSCSRCSDIVLDILAIVTLGYLGLGVQPPDARLGPDDRPTGRPTSPRAGSSSRSRASRWSSPRSGSR